MRRNRLKNDAHYRCAEARPAFHEELTSSTYVRHAVADLPHPLPPARAAGRNYSSTEQVAAGGEKCLYYDQRAARGCRLFQANPSGGFTAMICLDDIEVTITAATTATAWLGDAATATA